MEITNGLDASLIPHQASAIIIKGDGFGLPVDVVIFLFSSVGFFFCSIISIVYFFGWLHERKMLACEICTLELS